MNSRSLVIPIVMLLLAPLALAEGISVNDPAGMPVSGTIGVSWQLWVEDNSRIFNVSFAQRTYDGNGSVVSETRTLACENVIGHWCDADTAILENGTYAVVVSSGAMEGYSNDFPVANEHATTQAQNNIVVTQPTGGEVSGTIGVGWHTWIPNEPQMFNVSFAKRAYDGEGNVISETRTLACQNVVGQWCDADTTVLEDGTYAIVVSAKGMDGYSSDIAVTNGLAPSNPEIPDGITVTQPTGVTLNGTIGVGWYAWVQNSSQAFNVSFVQRIYNNGTLVGEVRTLACENVIGQWCDADTTILSDGTYAIAVTSGNHVGYSNDFAVLNHPPHAPVIQVIEPRGVAISGIATISWNASDEDGDSLSFTAYLVQRTYNGSGAVDGELSAPLCSTTANSCTFDTRMFADGNYVVVVGASDGLLTTEGYSNDFAISNGMLSGDENSSEQTIAEEAPVLRRGGRRCCSRIYTPENNSANATVNMSTNQTNATLVPLSELISSETVTLLAATDQPTQPPVVASVATPAVPAQSKLQAGAVLVMGLMLLAALVVSV